VSTVRIAAMIEWALDFLCAAALAVITATMIYQVFGRYILGEVPIWPGELARYLLVWLTMLGAAVAMRSGGHFSVTLLIDRLPPRWLRIVLGLRDAAVVVICGAVVGRGVRFAALNSAQESPALEIPMSIPDAALPAGMALIVILVLAARLIGRPFRATPPKRV
jgi:TRAP-type C4-dicarboxylate transport system permease small subunit